MAGQPRTRAKRGDGYTPELGERICSLVAEGKGLAAIEAMRGMPPRRTVRRWLEKYPEFEEAYERARRWRADSLVDEALALTDSVLGSSDNASVTAARNASDLRRWLAAKLLPSRFGDRLEVAGDPDAPLIPQEIDNSKIALAIVNLLTEAKKNEPLPPITIDVTPAPDEAVALPAPVPPQAAHPAILSGSVTEAHVVQLRPERPQLPSSYYRR